MMSILKYSTVVFQLNVYLVNWDLKNCFVNYVVVILCLFDVSPPTIENFPMLLVQVLGCPQGGRCPLVPGKFHLQSDNCTPKT